MRVSAKTRGDVGRLARASGRTVSAVVRDAIEDYVERTPPRPYEALQDVIGMVLTRPEREAVGTVFTSRLRAAPER
ncbi:MAG TPA: ribbon-helix-helix protein, CopG family [Vicinamibacteria bacterium]|nr:ribbon-helix-helix protein, CopG family [Vicinamibacteria bacterium]